MNILVVIVFAITLIYFSMTERFRIYAGLIGFQGCCCLSCRSSN